MHILKNISSRNSCKIITAFERSQPTSPPLLHQRHLLQNKRHPPLLLQHGLPTPLQITFIKPFRAFLLQHDLPPPLPLPTLSMPLPRDYLSSGIRVVVRSGLPGDSVVLSKRRNKARDARSARKVLRGVFGGRRKY